MHAYTQVAIIIAKYVTHYIAIAVCIASYQNFNGVVFVTVANIQLAS